MHISTLGAFAFAASLVLPAIAGAQERTGQIQGFGGFTMRSFTPAPSFGGVVAVPLTGHIQVVAEGGKLTDVMTPALASLIDFTPFDVRMSALYGQAGVRILGNAPTAAVRPYGEASAGMARLRASVGGFGSSTDLGINSALRFLDRTSPVLGLGAGLVIQGGPVAIDLGYRYQTFRSENVVQSVLGGGDIRVSQVRLGLGVRF